MAAINGVLLGLLKSGDHVVEVARSEADLGLAQIAADADAARAAVRERYSALSANSEAQTLSMPRAQVSTSSAQTSSAQTQAAPQRANIPVRGLW